jgi:signal peptidase II
MTSSIARRAASLLVPFTLVIVLDRLSKIWVRATLWDPPRDLVLVPGWLELTPVQNRGIAFGIMQDTGGILALVAVIVLGLVALRNWRQLLNASILLRIPLGMIAGGALGNVIDRAELGYVTDFIRVPPIWLFQVFNVADASICVGAALLALALWFGDCKPKKSEEQKKVPATVEHSPPSSGEETESPEPATAGQPAAPLLPDPPPQGGRGSSS